MNISQETVVELQSIRAELCKLFVRSRRLRDDEQAMENCEANLFSATSHIEDAIIYVDSFLEEEADIPDDDPRPEDLTDEQLLGGFSLPPSNSSPGGSITGF